MNKLDKKNTQYKQNKNLFAQADMHDMSMCNPEESKNKGNGQNEVWAAVSKDVSSALEETDSQCEAVDKNTESPRAGEGCHSQRSRRGTFHLSQERQAWQQMPPHKTDG